MSEVDEELMMDKTDVLNRVQIPSPASDDH